MTPTEKFTRHRQYEGRSATQQQLTVVAAVAGFDRPFTPDTLLADLAAKDIAVSRATLYRTLWDMEQAGMLTRHDDRFAYRP